MVQQPKEGGQRKCSSLTNKPGKLVTANKKKVEVLNNLFVPILNRNFQGLVGKISEQTKVVENVPAH